jgi:DNA uptake protein ComE-like DNA-binding protein
LGAPAPLADDPRRARALGVGRPDLEDAFDGGLIDVNGAPEAVLRRLPGYDAALAGRTVDVRDELGGFASLEELGALLELTGPQVEALREQAVFLPAQGR